MNKLGFGDLMDLVFFSTKPSGKHYLTSLSLNFPSVKKKKKVTIMLIFSKFYELDK